MSRRQVLRSAVLLVRPGRTVLGLGLLLSGFALLGQAIALGSGGALDDQRATPWHMPPPTHQA
jgi:hypothetical protein